MIFTALTFIVNFFCTAAYAGYEINVFAMEYGKQYSVITIRHIEGPSRSFVASEFTPGKRVNDLSVSPSGIAHRNFIEPHFETGEQYGQFAEGILDTAQSWLLDYYDQRGIVKKGTQLFEELKGIENIKDGRSSIVLITSLHNPKDIKAMLRVSVRGDSPSLEKLPLEKRNGILVPRPDAVDDIFFQAFNGDSDILPLGAEVNKTGRWSSEWPEDYELHHVVYGDVVELKNFAVEKGFGPDFIPILVFTAELTGITTQGSRAKGNYPHNENWKLRPEVQNYVNVITPNQYRYPPLDELHINENLSTILPSQYVLECLPSAERYYRMMGFTKMENFSTPEISIMQISRAKLKARIDKFLSQWDKDRLQNQDIRFKYMWTDHNWKNLFEIGSALSCGEVMKVPIKSF